MIRLLKSQVDVVNRECSSLFPYWKELGRNFTLDIQGIDGTLFVHQDKVLAVEIENIGESKEKVVKHVPNADALVSTTYNMAFIKGVTLGRIVLKVSTDKFSKGILSPTEGILGCYDLYME